MRSAYLFLFTYVSGSLYQPVALIRADGGKAGLPGGRCEESESFEDSLKRHLRRLLPIEGPILADLVTSDTTYVDSYLDYAWDSHHTRIYLLNSKIFKRNLTYKDEGVEMHDYASIEDLRYIINFHITYPTIKHVKDVVEYLEGGGPISNRKRSKCIVSDDDLKEK